MLVAHARSKWSKSAECNIALLVIALMPHYALTHAQKSIYGLLSDAKH